MKELTEKDAADLKKAAGIFAEESIGDFVYQIRERELQGWEGERVVAFGVASEIIHRLRQEGKI